MNDAKEKLVNLEKYMPMPKQHKTYEFGRFLAGRLDSELYPVGFVTACELALYDLKTGIDGITNKPINNNLVGYPAMVYAAIEITIPEIAKAIFPTEFAREVEAVIGEVSRKTRA